MLKLPLWQDCFCDFFGCL